MTNPTPQFWHFSYPVDAGNGDGTKLFMQGIGQDEHDARMQARMYSERHGHATVTNREGLVATYVGGKEHFYQK